jgi:hypothetical protein
VPVVFPASPVMPLLLAMNPSSSEHPRMLPGEMP